MINIRCFDLAKHRTAGLCLAVQDGRLILGGMTPSTPGAKIPRWRMRIKGAWLMQVGPDIVNTILEVQAAFERLSIAGIATIPLLFSHPEIQQDISHDSLPIVLSIPFHQQVHDQMN